MEVQQPDRKDKWKHKTNSELGMCDLIAERTRFGLSHPHIGETGKQRNSTRPPRLWPTTTLRTAVTTLTAKSDLNQNQFGGQRKP